MLGLRKKDPAKALREALGDYSLPSFPALVMRVLERMRDEEASVSDVVAMISLDPGLSVRLLATVNSAAYATRQRIDSLAQAVALLGMSKVESLLLAIAVHGSLPRSGCEGFDVSRFWTTAARRAATGQAIAARLHPASNTETFTAALLQDMAVPLLAEARPQQYAEVLRQWHDSELELVDIERRQLGVDHAEVGMWLCQHWDLPEGLRIAVGAHHIAAADPAPECPLAVRLVAPLREVAQPHEDRALLEALLAVGLDEQEVTELLEAARGKATELASLFA